MKLAAAAALAALAGTALAKDERTFSVLRFNGKQLTKGRVDPLVDPGRPAPHVHTVLGGSNFGINSTGQDLLESKCTTAMVKGDNSNYWFPSLFYKDHESGKLEEVQVFYVNVYYFFEATNDIIKPFPVGLGIVSGDVNARTPPASGPITNVDPSKGPINAVKWTCPRTSYDPPSWPADSDGTTAGIGDPINKGEGVGFPHVNCDGYASPLRGDVHFPSCYDPSKGLTDYKNNMQFASDSGNGKVDCPKGWIHVPHLFMEIYWNTPLFKDSWQQGKGTQPFVLSNGDATGYSLHADFMAGWNEELLQHIIDTCNTGTAGMDKCPGLDAFGGVNTETCTIDNPVPEAVSGILSALPGGRTISGWSYGNAGAQEPVGGQIVPPAVSGAKSTGKPAGTQGSGTTNAPVQSAAATHAATDIVQPANAEANAPAQPSELLRAPASLRVPKYAAQKIKTVWETKTVYETLQPEATAAIAANNRRHAANHMARHHRHH